MHRRRRRIDAVLAVLAVVLVGAAAAIGALAGDTERIADYWLHAELEGPGQATVVEVIDYDFGPNSRRGLLRNIPDVSADADIVVSSPTAPDQLQVTGSSREARLRVGDPAVTIRNRHRYRIEYPIETLLVGERVSWNAIGTDWDVPISAAEIHLTAPFGLEAPQCDQGRRGRVGGCVAVEVEPGHLVVEASGIDPGEGVTLSATVGDPLASPSSPTAPMGPAEDPGSGWLSPGLAAAAAALIGGAAVSAWVQRLGREQVWHGGPADAAFGPPDGTIAGVELVDHADLAEMATIEFEAPRDLSAAAGGIILAEKVRPTHQMAWLMESAIRGEIEVIDRDEKDFVIVRGATTPHPVVAPTLDAMFSGREQIELGSYDPQFAAAWKQLAGELETWRRASGMWDPAGRTRRNRARMLGVLGALAGLAGTVLGGVLANRSGAGWLVLAAVGGIVAGAGLLALIRAWELPVRTPEGSARWLQIESFRRFVSESEARHAEAAASMGVLRQYTAWAVAVGELPHWQKAVDAAAAMPGSAVTSSVNDLRFISMASGLSRATTSTFTAPSSSGGGGGGGVGGGGGGGGGGSW